MTQQLEKEMKMYNGKVFGFKVSDYALENGYLDYETLSKIVGGAVLNNNIMQVVGYENWELVCGCEEDADGGWYDIYQYYADYTDEIVYYNEDLDMYVWGITHFGTSWDYVLTDIKLVEEMN